MTLETIRENYNNRVQTKSDGNRWVTLSLLEAYTIVTSYPDSGVVILASHSSPGVVEKVTKQNLEQCITKVIATCDLVFALPAADEPQWWLVCAHSSGDPDYIALAVYAEEDNVHDLVAKALGIFLSADEKEQYDWTDDGYLSSDDVVYDFMYPCGSQPPKIEQESCCLTKIQVHQSGAIHIWEDGGLKPLEETKYQK